MTNMSGLYVWMRKVLKNMSDEQLTELFYDLEDIEAVKRIERLSKLFIEKGKLK